MHLLWLAKVEDDTIFIITLGVVLLVVITYLVLGRDDTIRLQEDETPKTNESEHQNNVIHRLDRANDLLISIRNSILILIVLIVLLPVLFLLLTKGCSTNTENSSAHVLDRPNTYNMHFSTEK